MNRLRDYMTPMSKLRYLAWRASLLGDEVTVQLTTGEWLILQKSMQFGLGVGYEIVVEGSYRPPRPIDPGLIRRIVDVGANVGFTVAYWAARFPEARIEAVEPLPAHVEALRRIVRLNHCEDRTTIHAAAAGIAAGVCEMVSAGVCSTVIGPREPEGAAASLERIAVPVVDIFELIGSAHIDLLKIDCEGAEYDILMDPRFRALDADNLVMEWHATEEHPEADSDLISRLRDLQWVVEPISSSSVKNLDGLGFLRAGMAWGFRQ
jgi:FkbM family methyltransferase